MAKTVEITKAIPVKGITDRDFTVSVNVVIKDDGVEVFSRDFSTQYDNTTSPNEIEAAFQGMIKEAWDIYSEELEIYNAAAFDSMITSLESAATTYVNS